jgi:hypothetical protein
MCPCTGLASSNTQTFWVSASIEYTFISYHLRSFRLITHHYAHFLIRTSIHQLTSRPEATSHPKKKQRGEKPLAIVPPMVCYQQQCSRNPSLGLNNGLTIRKTPNVMPGPVYIAAT